MSSQPDDTVGNGRAVNESVSATKRSVYERLADPYLTEHDRWVLQQFGRFLSGILPEPAPRALSIGDKPPERNQLDPR